jgi:putative addiction module killer protein
MQEPIFKVLVYCDQRGRYPYSEWLDELDIAVKARVEARVRRLIFGNLGDWKPIADGLAELRLNHGPGYRIYFGIGFMKIVVLLAGGNKGTQRCDIAKAMNYWHDFQEHYSD